MLDVEAKFCYLDKRARLGYNGVVSNKDQLKRSVKAVVTVVSFVFAGLLPTAVAAAGTSLGSLKPTIDVATDAGDLGQALVTLVIVVAALLALFYMVMGAINWIRSGGDKTKLEEARYQIVAAVVGLLVLASVWALYQLVLTVSFGKTDIEVPKLTES